MAAQPPKRRKTSPLKATPVFNGAAEPVSASRASYMSPTRASLSRFNPSLLPQARFMSAGPVGKRAVETPVTGANARQNMTPDQFITHGQEALSYIMSNFNAQMQKTLSAISGDKNSPLVTNQPMLASPGVFGADNNGTARTPHGDETDEQMEAMRAAIRARKLQERAGSARSTSTSIRRTAAAAVIPQLPAGEDGDELSLEIGRNNGAGSARSRLAPQSAIKPMARIMSMPSAASEDMEIDPAVDEELEIDELSPDALRQPNLRVQRLATEDDGLPDTPEAIRRQLEAEDHPRRGVLFSSPSKRRRSQVTPKKKKQPAPVQRIAPEEPPVEPPVEPEEVAQDASPAAAKAPTEAVPAPPAAPDPNVLAKREEKAKLEGELRELQEEIKQLERYAQVYTGNGEDATEDIGSVISLLNSSRAVDKRRQTETALSSLLTSFLPFSIPIAPAAKASESAEEEQHFVSHEPLKEDDPLLLNSIFTPLSITSSTHAPTSILGSDRLRQKHSLTLSSPSSLLTCSLDMTVSSEPSLGSVPTIDSLDLKDVSHWAHAEIGPWLEQRCKEGDIAAVGYGLGRYWDISVKRAQCWMQCQKQFPSLVSSPSSDGQTGDEEEETSSEIYTIKLSQRKLLPHLGRSILTLQSEDIILRISWKLQFDWTGDVESAVSVETALPQSWHETDTSDALRKIPATFDALMRDWGVIQAVGVVGGLLFDTRA